MFAPEDAQRELKKKKKKKKKRRRRKKIQEPDLAEDSSGPELSLQAPQIPNPTKNPTDAPTDAPTPEPVIEFTVFANILKDANMTQDEKVR